MGLGQRNAAMHSSSPYYLLFIAVLLGLYVFSDQWGGKAREHNDEYSTHLNLEFCAEVPEGSAAPEFRVEGTHWLRDRAWQRKATVGPRWYCWQPHQIFQEGEMQPPEWTLMPRNGSAKSVTRLMARFPTWIEGQLGVRMQHVDRDRDGNFYVKIVTPSHPRQTVISPAEIPEDMTNKGLFYSGLL